MNKRVIRKYLEIKNLKNLKEKKKPHNFSQLKTKKIKDFQLNKFFYKQIGKKYNWIDRLVWNDQKWINYISNKNLVTIILKNEEDLIGYYELILHDLEKEVEIGYFGILEEYFGNKLGGFLLSHAIKNSFLLDIKRVWVHTCSLDHPNALENYLARGMNIFKKEDIIL